MADKIKKFLARLSAKELDGVLALLLDIRNGDLAHLDIKPLKGQKKLFRARKGRIRVIFYMDKKEIRILSISNRDEQTYIDF